MSPQDNDHIPSIPAIVPDRDDVEHYQRQKAGKQKPPAEPVPARSDDRDAHVAPSRVPLYVLGVLAVAALGWAGYLQMQLSQTLSALDGWQTRVADLEKRLSLTDESANQSSATLQVKFKELDATVSKLRDDNFKRASAAIDQHGRQLTALEKSVKEVQAAAGRIDRTVAEQQKVVGANKQQLDSLAPTVELAKRKLEEQQAAIESVTEKSKANAVRLDKLTARVSTNEDWVQSINNFRKQTNREIVNIKQQLGGPVQEKTPQ